MRSFLAFSLAVAAGCGDDLSGPADPMDDGADQGAAVDTNTAQKVLPEICATRTWDSVNYDAKDSVVRAVPTVTGAALFMVPKSGGMLRGFEVDGRGTVIGDPTGRKIRSDMMFTDLSATRLDDRYIVGLVSNGQVSINAVKDDLTEYRELAIASGSLVGDQTVVWSRNARIATTGGAGGMMSTRFDAEWASMGSTALAHSVPTSMTTAAYGNDAMVAWSTETTCHLQRVAAGVESTRPYACKNGRLAVNFEERGGWMVYERGASVMIARIEVNGHNPIANENLLTRFGTSPRIAFDGAHYWVSYIDARGDLVVGMVDSTGSLDSAAVEGTQPMHDAYDLAVAAGSAWVFALDGNGLGATRLCKVAK
ncbi:MAG: hypothetical protein H0T46_30775 [Deltaproteobacteria bacterium]|nr:hypothetical protein [Deltaproteobacteria bacterium]